MTESCKDSWRAKNKDGYHILSSKYWGYNLEHRYLYAIHHNIELESSDIIRHTCNNSWCVEITHLVKGTQKENMQDIIADKGKRNSTHTRDEIETILDMFHYDEMSHAEIARRTGIPRRTVSHIINRETWSHIP